MDKTLKTLQKLSNKANKQRHKQYELERSVVETFYDELFERFPDLELDLRYAPNPLNQQPILMIAPHETFTEEVQQFFQDNLTIIAESLRFLTYVWGEPYRAKTNKKEWENFREQALRTRESVG